MPTSLHPQAKFDPIPPDLDLYGLVDRCANFEWVLRISTHQIRNIGPEEFEKLVLLHVVNGGKPLVIEGWDEVLDSNLFNADWLERTYDKKQENVRDITGQTEIPMTTGHYLRSMKQLTNQWTPNNFRDERRQRLYLKDIDCPAEWQEALRKVIPPSLFYLNENATERGGGDKRNTDMFGGTTEATAASAGDLMSSLAEEMRAQNLMCYIGHEGTYTPAHREMCASLGQNIMVEASGDENGEKPGSSIWFMTETKDREVVREYFLSMLGHDVEIEKHFAQVNAWKKATFPVYIVDQRPGDFILIPPLAPHQVWNRGTRTMKVAWNRTTSETLDLALHEALPKARLVCRDEQYKNKAIIYYTLQKYHRLLQEAEEKNEMSLLGFGGFGQDLFRSSPRFKQLAGDFRRLFALFTEILTDEMFASKEKDVEYVEFDSCVICSYCRSNIFNRFLTCKNCVRTLVGGDEDAYDICMECYAMGRSCMCQSNLTWCEQFPWSELVDNFENWRAMIIKNDGFVDMELSPAPLEIARQRRGKKSTAQVCQEALKRRPFKDLTKLEEEKVATESEPEVDDEGRPKKKKNKRKRKLGELRRCHVCCHKDYSYRVHECTNPGCKEAYCYGVLYRAFDLMPQTVQEDEHWQCPKCLKICNCGACRRIGLGDPYMPKNTLLGHDTKAIADDRSVELLVDFRVHNLNWIKAMGEESRNTNSKRMQELRQQADVAKAQDETGQATQEAIANATNGVHHPGQEHMGAYGDQGHLFGAQIDSTLASHAADGQDAHHDLENAQPPHPYAPDSIDLTSSHFVGDESAYPDPMMMGGQRMLGMGYYDQDTGPDQILFDPFQLPSVDAMVFDEEAEVVKKALRAQKRKAKLQNEDDPDFPQPKYQNKKKKRDNADLGVVDPALLGGAGPSAAGDAPSAGANTPDEEAGPAAQLAEETQQQAAKEISQPPSKVPLFEANVPELRHARPKVSYAEADDAVAEDAEDLLPAWNSWSSGGRRAIAQLDPVLDREQTTDPLHEASDAVQALPTKGLAAGIGGSDATLTGKRRGRPPKSLSGASPSSTRASTRANESPVPSGSEEATQRRAARASRRSTLSAMEMADNTAVNEEVGETRPTAADIAAELDEVFGADDDNPVPASLPKRRGRPPKAKSQAAARGMSQDDDAPRPMTMAERVAARGKKFKIGSRKPGIRPTRGGIASSSRPDSPRRSSHKNRPVETSRVPERGSSSELVTEAQFDDKNMGDTGAPDGHDLPREPLDQDFIPYQSSPPPPSSPSAGYLDPSPPPRPARLGPTIVRLGSFSGSEYGDGGNDAGEPLLEVESPSERTSSSDDDDIPNEPKGNTMRPRGRGGARGRPRGRGRGRGRGRA